MDRDSELYPLMLEPLERELVWGGDALVRRYGKPGSAQASIGESWECWDANRVTNGAYAGKSLGDVRAELGERLVGSADPARIFPLLTKLIDAHAALSVQVHPDDAYAQRVEKQPFGKAESWLILDAQSDASIVLGWNRDTSRGEYLERVRDGSLDALLRRVFVHPGDVFDLPAGTLHAIGAGIVLFETQQASDLTYRIFDYNRPGPDGKPRELNVDKAADVLDYRESRAGALRSLEYELDRLARTTLIANRRFIVERIALTSEPRGVDLEGMPLIVMALGLPVEVETCGVVARLEAYRTAVVPAAARVAMLRSVGVEATLVTAAPPADAYAIERRYSRSGVAVSESSAFLAQF
ncbi:MAG: class I mannose-6-phosphate isomerase [Candidatus Eremiobacteraeota bacterium]|nr:class I mannose-6-phosphate isomerase [Candidatus Eremiobacteraeota bacterium]